MSGQSPYMSTAPYGYSTGFQPRDTRYPSGPTVETAMGIHRRPSLLAGYHNPYSSPERTSIHPYLFSLAAPVSMGPHADEHSKRSRYPSNVPLSIDIKKETPLYQPQTEAISPIFDDPKARDTSTIRNAISKLESDIEITKKKLDRAKLSQSEIRSQADRSAADEEEEESDDRDNLFNTNGSQTLIEKILHDNRKKAEDSQKVLNPLTDNMDLTIPLYQEPNDLASIDKIRRQYMHVMKNHLINLLKKSRERYMRRTKFESEHYDQAYRQWQKSIEKEERSILAKDITTYRETFEKTFPELRKAREDKEKKQSTQNANDSSSSSNEQQITTNSNTIEQENEEETDEKMRKSSVIPPIMYDSWQRKHQYFNQNALVREDPASFYKEHTKMPYWSPEEKQIFIEKFTQSPKNFGYISSFLENKTTEQCVQFYYMTKKSENYKNLLRKQSQANKRKTKQNTTTTVTSSTTIETTLVTKVTSNTIISSTSQQILGSGQDMDRSIDRMDNDEERRDKDSGENNEEKRSNKKCQFLSCTTDRSGKKKPRKYRLRAFPTKWNELSNEYQEEIRRALQIPPNVQRCCTRCYDKLINEIRKRKVNQPLEEDDDDNEESAITVHQKQDEEEWSKAEIDVFAQALNKFNHDWSQIAEYCHRSEESCRAYYLKHYKNASPIDNIDEDNGSISGSEIGQTKQNNDDSQLKTINDDSNDSTHGMVIDEGEEHSSLAEEKPSKSIPLAAHLTTITSLVEKEISKTLSETESRSLSSTNTKTKASSSPERVLTSNNSNTNTSVNNTNNVAQPPPLITVTKSHSTTPPYRHSPHPPQQAYVNKGSIMRGTPIASATPTNKPIAVDIPPAHPHPHHYNNPRNDYSHLRSPKILDRSIEQQQQQQQQQQHLLQQQQAAQMRHYVHPQQYLQQQQQQQQHKSSATKLDPTNTDTFETLRADYVTSKYLTTTHSPNHDRPHRTGPEQHSPSQMSSSMGQQLLPPPTAIATSNSNSSVPPSPHHHQQQAALLAASQLLASGVYPQELLSSGLIPYPSYYGSSATNPQFLFDQRLMHEYANAAAAAANNEQLKGDHQKVAMRLARPHHPASMRGHSPPDPAYSSAASKRHPQDMGYPTNDYPPSMWHTPNMNNHQQLQMKHHPSGNENPLLKLNELSRYSSTHPSERSSRSPDERHHGNQSCNTIESPSMHFQRVEALNHKLPHDKSNSNLHYHDPSADGNSLNYIRQPPNVHKPQPTLHSPHRHHHHGTNPTNRPIGPPMQSSQISPHHPPYLMPGHHHNPIDTLSSQRQQQQPSPHHHQPHYPQSQQRTADHSDLLINAKEPMSIQDFINKNVNDFVGPTNTDNKNTNSELSSFEPHGNQPTRSHQTSNSDQTIFIDVDDDSNPVEHSDITNKSNTEGGMFERRRDSSIKKILSNQPLEKQEYIDINQKVQNSSVGASKIHSNNDQTAGERSNATGERTRSRGSITMRMLMGANDIYADGKAQPIPTNETQSTKRAASPSTDKCEKIEYLIRDGLERPCPALVKRDEAMAIFQKSSSNQPPQHNASKRLRPSPKDEEQRQSSFYSSHESQNNTRDPFALQPQSKNQHHQSASSTHTEKNWQSFVQQQYQLSNPYSSQFATRTSRPAGSITQGSPISSLRLSTDQQQYSSATNNQLVHPRYSYYANKNEQQSSPSGQPSIDNSPKGKLFRRANQTYSSSSDAPSEPITSEHSSTLKSPSTNPVSTDTNVSKTPPIPTSPPPTAASNSAHPLKKRLINEYELEQHRNSPVVPPPPTTSIEKVENNEEITNTSHVDTSKNDTENHSNPELNDETTRKSSEDTDNST